jgi:hypothetical protein
LRTKVGMTVMDAIEISAGEPSQSRREALRRFGRYAAAAPAAMVLLQPNEGHAGKGKGKRKGKRKGGKKGHY